MSSSSQRFHALCNPEKVSARTIMYYAVKTGRLVKKESCEVCGDHTQGVEGHHTDYSKPLDVLWLCPVCHRQADKERQAQEQNEGFATRMELRVPWDLVHQIDAARGLVSRSAWIRQVIEEKLKIFDAEEPMREAQILSAAASLGQKGGSAQSERKSQAARENGKKGGRPRKVKPPDEDK